MLASLGDTTFRDATIPAPSKSEFGMDTLTRHVEGFVGEDGENLQAFIESLNQGDTYDFGGVLFYLQTWSPDEGTPICTVTLNYKGLKPGGTPETDIQTEIAPASGSISANWSTENDELGRIYRNEPITLFQFGPPDPLPGVGDPVILDRVIIKRDIYATGATMEFTYDAVQTTYRYVTEGRPNAPRYFQVDIPRVPVIKKSRITISDGTVYGTNAPGAVLVDLTPLVLNRVVGFSSHHVIGSPYYECEDTVRRELGEGDSDTEGSFVE